jgi:hypothetical protein
MSKEMKLSFLRDDFRLVAANDDLPLTAGSFLPQIRIKANLRAVRRRLIAIDHDLLFGGNLAVKLARVELHLNVESFFTAVEF